MATFAEAGVAEKKAVRTVGGPGLRPLALTSNHSTMKCTFPLALDLSHHVPWPGSRGRRRGPGPLPVLVPLGGGPPGAGVLGGLGRAAAESCPAPAAAALLLALTVLLTRGLHLDGLADTVDGLGGGRTPEDRLAIMKDSRVGAFGVVSLVLVLLLKFAFFLAWADQGRAPELLLLFP